MLSIVLIFISCLLTASNAVLPPLNQVVVAGEDAVFNCSNNPGSAHIRWEFYNQSSSLCTIHNGIIFPSPINGGCNQPRYNVSVPTGGGAGGQYTLTISNTQFSDVGTYVCTDQSDSASASAVYGVLASNPVIGSNVTEKCLLAGKTVVHTCQVNYTGSIYMQPVISWTNSTGHHVASNSSNSTGTFLSTMYVTATTLYIPSYTCTVTFNAPTGDTLPSHPATQATNAPSYNNISQTAAYNVQYCPGIINITFLNGTEFPGGNLTEPTTLNCSVSGGTSEISTSYNWTNWTESAGLKQTVDVPYGNYSLTCTATSSLCGTKLCTLSTTVTGHQYTTNQPPTTTVTTAPTPPNTPGSTQSPAVNSSTVTTVGSNTTATTDTITPQDVKPCYERVECIVPAVVCPVAGVAIIVAIIVLCFKLPKCPGYKSQHKHEKTSNENASDVSDSKQLATQQQKTMNASFTNDSYQDDQENSQKQTTKHSLPDVAVYAQPTTRLPPVDSHQYHNQQQQHTQTNRPQPTIQQPVSPEGIIYAQLAKESARSRAPVAAAAASETVYAQVQLA